MAYNTLQSQSFTRVALSSTKRMRTVVTTSAELYDKTRMLTRINSRKVINVPKQRISQSFSTTKDVFLQLIQMLYRRKLAASACFPPPSPKQKSPATFLPHQALHEVESQRCVELHMLPGAISRTTVLLV